MDTGSHDVVLLYSWEHHFIGDFLLIPINWQVRVQTITKDQGTYNMVGG
jgi:hypothetical protein